MADYVWLYTYFLDSNIIRLLQTLAHTSYISESFDTLVLSAGLGRGDPQVPGSNKSNKIRTSGADLRIETGATGTARRDIVGSDRNSRVWIHKRNYTERRIKSWSLQPKLVEFSYCITKALFSTVYRSARNTRCALAKIDGNPPLQPKLLDRIGSNFSRKLFRRIVSGAPRRFLNFVLGAEILGIFMLILGPLEGPKIPLNGLQKAPYLGF